MGAVVARFYDWRLTQSDRMRFELQWCDREAGPARAVRRFLDYVVDGESIFERIGQDMISPIGWSATDQEDVAAARLLGEHVPDVDDRVAIFVCSECGDVECGFVSARIERRGDEVIWKDFANSWHDHFPDGPEGDAGDVWRHEPIDLNGQSELRFDAQEYRSAIVNGPRTSPSNF